MILLVPAPGVPVRRSLAGQGELLISGRAKEPFEPVVLFSAFFATYVLGALDVVLRRGMRLQHTIHFYGDYDAGLRTPGAALYLSLALLIVTLEQLHFIWAIASTLPVIMALLNQGVLSIPTSLTR